MSTSASPASRLFKPYRKTGIKLAQVPLPDQQTVKDNDDASNLSSAEAIVANVQTAVTTCQQQYAALQSWVTLDNRYQAAVTLARKNHKPTDKIAKPGPPPPAAGSTCPPPQAFGIAAKAVTLPAAGSS